MGVYKVCVYSIYTVNEIEIDGVCLILCHCYLGEEKKKMFTLLFRLVCSQYRNRLRHGIS